MFQSFTAPEYLKIDLANSFGYDKVSWDSRLAWFDENEDCLSSLVQQAEAPALYYAGTLAWEKHKRGEPSGYPISLDATCSGIQILAALACDRSAAEICNVVDTGHREDAYVSIYMDMVHKMGGSAKIDRKKTKQAIMTAFYGSTAQPKNIFGEGQLLNVFYETIKERAPGAWEINETMLAIWDKTKLVNEWVLPDNFHVVIKVMGQVKENVHFLDQPFEVPYNINMPIEGGRSLGANMVHSIDGMMVREMQRRCNFDPKKIKELTHLLKSGCCSTRISRHEDKMVQVLWQRYQESRFLSARILSYLSIDNMGLIDNPQIVLDLIHSLPRKPFEVVSIHDCFRCLPNYGNDLRQQYNNLLAEIASSELLSSILSQITGRPIHAGKLDPSLSRDVLLSNYALS